MKGFVDIRLESAQKIYALALDEQDIASLSAASVKREGGADLRRFARSLDSNSAKHPQSK